MLYAHWRDFDLDWRWPNFSIQRLACPHCGEYFHDPKTLDMIQAARNKLGTPIIVNSGHRCFIHNIHVGGTPFSMHRRRIAIDVRLTRNRDTILAALKYAGFTTFGYYQTFIHTDIRPNRAWYGSKIARKLWKS